MAAHHAKRRLVRNVLTSLSPCIVKSKHIQTRSTGILYTTQLRSIPDNALSACDMEAVDTLSGRTAMHVAGCCGRNADGMVEAHVG